MGFWDMSDGESAKGTGTEYEVPSGNLDPIPNNSDVLAMVEVAKWNKFNDVENINLQWTVLEPEQFKNRKVFQKLWVTDLDPQAKSQDAATKKRDKALQMLSAIDANCGGKLEQVSGVPTDDDLAMALQDRPMIIKCMVWEIEDRYGEKKSGNWVSAVKPRTAGVSVSEDAPKPQGQQQQNQTRDLDDSIPF